MKNERQAPTYLDLYRRFRDDVVRGVYPHGAKLPSKRTAADSQASAL